MTPLQDPGWGFARRALNPFVAFRPTSGPAPDNLTQFRMVYLGLVLALPLTAVSFSFVFDMFGSAGVAALVIVVVGLLSVVGIEILRRRPLATGSAASLAGSWRKRFLIGVAIAESAAMVGVALTAVVNAVWVSLIGMGFALVDLLRIGPTRRNLDRDQQAIRSAGSPLDLTGSPDDGGSNRWLDGMSARNGRR